MNFKSLTIIFFVFFGYRVIAKPKDLKNLEADKKKLIQEISKVQKLISLKENNYQRTLSQIKVTNSQIKKIVQIIEKIDTDLKQIDKQIDRQSIIITKLHNDLEKLKKEYSDALWQAHKTKTKLSNISYVLYPNAYQNYSRKFSNYKFYIKYRTKHIIDIKLNYKKLSLEKNRFEEYRKIQNNLLNSRKKEFQDLQGLKLSHSKLCEKLHKEKLSLTEELEKKRKNVAGLNAAINKIIQDNIAKQRAKKLQEAKNAQAQQSANKSSQALKTLNKAEYEASLKLTKNFAETKGRLTWPVSRGIVTGKFGTHTHPELRNVQICNLGVNIQTESNATVRAVFEGKVVSVMRMPGMQNIVVLAHGEYHTVYVMLAEVHVTEGADVKSGDPLGRAGSASSEIQFQIWDHGVKVDPEQWLAR